MPHVCAHISAAILLACICMMSGTSELPIVLDSDTDGTSDNATDVEEMEEAKVVQTKGSPLKLICTKRHQ